MNTKMLIDEKRINPNISDLSRYFTKKTSAYFNKDGSPKKVYFEETGCYSCGSNKYTSEFRANNFRHVRCKVCGMVYVNPRLKKSITHNLYSESDYAESFKIKHIPSIDYRRNVLARNKYNQIIKYFNKPPKVLDIGCGLGEVLSIFKEEGSDCTGIEFNSITAKYASDKFGLHIINKSIFDPDEFFGKSYDLIMLWGVLEHLYDPKSILRRINRLLKPNGILVLEVPSADSFLVRFAEATAKAVDRIVEGDRHIMLFSLTSFKQMTESCGFAPVKIFSNGLDIATINRMYMNDSIDRKNVNMLQAFLDESYQGDLLRGFFKSRKAE